MAKVMVVTDGVAGIPKKLAEEYQIKIVPTASIIYDGHTYLEGATIDATRAYQRYPGLPATTRRPRQIYHRRHVAGLSP